jgi:hypothetical protein
LTQAEGSRDVSGTDKKFELTGVVSGKSLYLLFADVRSWPLSVKRLSPALEEVFGHASAA